MLLKRWIIAQTRHPKPMVKIYQLINNILIQLFVFFCFYFLNLTLRMGKIINWFILLDIILVSYFISNWLADFCGIFLTFFGTCLEQTKSLQWECVRNSCAVRCQRANVCIRARKIGTQENRIDSITIVRCRRRQRCRGIARFTM